jgi:hypothetical protein
MAFSGQPDPFCDALDSCGATGTVGLSLGGVQGTLTLTASRQVAKRADAHQALADLRRGKLGFDSRALSASLSAAETFVAADGSRCQESSTSPVQLVLGAGRSRTSVPLNVYTNNQFNDVLRTYCPGPSQTDALGQAQGTLGLARGSISVAQLLAPRSTVSLTNPGGFSGTGYDGSRSGGLGVALTRYSRRSRSPGLRAVSQPS